MGADGCADRVHDDLARMEMLLDVAAHLFGSFGIVAVAEENSLLLDVFRFITEAFVHPVHDFFGAAQFFAWLQLSVHKLQQGMDVQ